MKNILKFCVVFLAIACNGEVAKSDDFEWTGLGGNNSWNNAGNWENVTMGGGSDVDGIPDADDSVVFSINASTTNGQASEITVNAGVELQLLLGTITVFDTIINNGTIQFADTPNSSSNETLAIAGEVLLQGDGEIVLVNQSDSLIADAGDGVLRNLGNTIRGAGFVGAAVVNEALIRAENGELEFFAQSLDNSAGTIEIASNGALNGSESLTPIFGGTITGEPGGATIRGAYRDTTFEGLVFVDLIGAEFSNTIINNGTIQFADTPNSSSNETLFIVGDVTLLGFGEIFLVNSNDSLIAGSGGGQLSNQENTIRGRGRVNVPVINNGTLFADWPNADLVFNGSVSLPPVGSSVLAIRLDGLNSSQSSRLVFTNSIPTNGTLKIVAGDNFDAVVGQSTEVISSSGFQGPGFPLLNFSMAQSLTCLLYTSPSPRDRQKSRMPSSA